VAQLHQFIFPVSQYLMLSVFGSLPTYVTNPKFSLLCSINGVTFPANRADPTNDTYYGNPVILY